MNTEVKWTPGPWNASRFGCQVLTGDSWNSICELKGDARWQDGHGSYQQEYEWQVQEANARLIAAAPEMAEALAALLLQIEQGIDPLGNPDRAAYNAARAALSKAGG